MHQGTLSRDVGPGGTIVNCSKMKIICAGMSRTGTKTLSKALRLLGYNVFDYIEQVDTFKQEWRDLFFKGKKPDFKAMFNNVDAVTDTPCCLFFEELLDAFPDAKVILTVRDEEKWAKSVKSLLEHTTVLTLVSLISSQARTVKEFAAPINNALLGSMDPGSSYIHKQKFRWHNDRVKSVVPKDQLLVLDLKKGWEPLCDFLGHDIPKEAFPKENVQGGGITKFLLDMAFQEWPKLIMVLVIFLGILVAILLQIL